MPLGACGFESHPGHRAPDRPAVPSKAPQNALKTRLTERLRGSANCGFGDAHSGRLDERRLARGMKPKPAVLEEIEEQGCEPWDAWPHLVR